MTSQDADDITGRPLRVNGGRYSNQAGQRPRGS
jgi:hypothetical protein